LRLFTRAALGALAAAAIVAASLAGGQAQAAAPVTLRLAASPLGKMLVDPRGHTLYLFGHDKTTKSTCYGACAKDWPPFLSTVKPHAGAGVKASLVGLTRRKDGRMQVTYHGHPLYGFFLDKSAGQTKGEGLNFFGGVWDAVGASGLKLVAAASTTSSGSTGSGSTSGNGYGGGSYGGGGYGGG
jgi:predicted lipoprotein with Yx(FWY)xxD motif